jgi:hypothetical protein
MDQHYWHTNGEPSEKRKIALQVKDTTDKDILATKKSKWNATVQEPINRSEIDINTNLFQIRHGLKDEKLM